MTTKEYRLHYGADLLKFIQSPAGMDLISTLHQLRPTFTVNSQPHVHIESAGAVRGYELCEKNLLFLTTQPKPEEEIEATYGTETKQK